MFKSICLVARYDKRKALKLAEDLAVYFTGNGLKVFTEDTLIGKIKIESEPVPLQQMKTDLIVTIGGDGTILRTCQSIPRPEPPILGINMGVRGFLTEVEPEQAFEAADKLLKGEFTIERCMNLASLADRIAFPDALNEVVVSHDEPAKLLYTRVLKDGQPILDCQADSLLVSTQTGSTGYSLSAGGPVLDPGVDAYVLTPICPLTDFRPIVFPADSRLTIELVKPKRMLVIIDGQHCQTVRSERPVVTLTRSRYRTSFIRFRQNYYDRLRSRLLFRGTG